MSFERVAVAEKKSIDIFLQVKWMAMILENSRFFHFENEMIFKSNRYFLYPKDDVFLFFFVLLFMHFRSEFSWMTASVPHASQIKWQKFN